jgi:hypothetical protein
MANRRKIIAPAAASKRLSPQERAIEKKRALFRSLRASSTYDFDPDTYDWAKQGEHFDDVSDEEWSLVWRHVLAGSQIHPTNESRVRELVNDAAYSSGWFAEYGGELHISRADYRRFAEEDRRFLRKAQQFRNEMNAFFGEVPTDHKDPFDPWDVYRPVMPALDDLADYLQRRIDDDERRALIVEDAPNSVKRELDQWRARLLVVWGSECGLAIQNTKHLRGFLLDALRPYMPRAELTDRMAKHFINKWLAGGVKDPGPSLLYRLREDK